VGVGVKEPLLSDEDAFARARAFLANDPEHQKRVRRINWKIKRDRVKFRLGLDRKMKCGCRRWAYRRKPSGIWSLCPHHGLDAILARLDLAKHNA
jgi:hypothetical protein